MTRRHVDEPVAERAASEPDTPLDIRVCAALLALRPGTTVIVDGKELVRVPRDLAADAADAADDAAAEPEALEDEAAPDVLECARRIGLPPGRAEPLPAIELRGVDLPVARAKKPEPRFVGPKPAPLVDRYTRLRDDLLWPRLRPLAPLAEEPEPGEPAEPSVAEPDAPTLGLVPVPQIETHTDAFAPRDLGEFSRWYAQARTAFRWPGESRVPLSLVRDAIHASVANFAASPAIAPDLSYALDLPLRDEQTTPSSGEIPVTLELVEPAAGTQGVAYASADETARVAVARGARGVRRAPTRVLPEASLALLLGASLTGLLAVRRRR